MLIGINNNVIIYETRDGKTTGDCSRPVHMQAEDYIRLAAGIVGNFLSRVRGYDPLTHTAAAAQSPPPAIVRPTV